MPRLSHIETSPCGIAPLGRYVHKSRDSTLGLRDNGVAEWPGIEKLQTIMEDKNEDQMLELEQEEVMFTPKDHIIDEGCLEGLVGLNVQAIEMQENEDLLKSLQVVPLKGLEYVPTRGTNQAAGLDVRSTVNITIPPGE